jgi:hypothetical protein
VAIATLLNATTLVVAFDAAILAVAFVVVIRGLRSPGWLEPPKGGWLWDRPRREQTRFWVRTILLSAVGVYVGLHLPSSGLTGRWSGWLFSPSACGSWRALGVGAGRSSRNKPAISTRMRYLPRGDPGRDVAAESPDS